LKQSTVKIMMFIPALLLLFAIAALLIPNDVIEAFSGKIAPTGSIIIFVEDGNTKKPLQFANVTIPEAGQTLLTDENGKTETVRVPIVEDSEYKGMLPKPWGEITLLVYKQGYIDCAIFHVNVWENQTRNGPTVLLFPLSPDDANQPFTLTEGPNRLWVKQLLDKYRPVAVH
jgi:hypothetical protein